MVSAVERLTDTILARVSASQERVTTAVGSLNRSAATLGRLASQIDAAPDWPAHPLTGEVIFEMTVALLGEGVALPVFSCVGCNQQRPIFYVASQGPSCRSCGPKGTVVCPSGLHAMPFGSRHCKECREIKAIAVLVEASVAVGASVAQAREAIAHALPSYLQLLSAAKWIEVGHSLVESDPGPDSTQQLRRYLVERGVGIAPRCIACGAERELRYQGEDGRLCIMCFMKAAAETCINCRNVRPVVWRDPNGRPWCGICRRAHVDRVAKCSRCGLVGPVGSRSDGQVVGTCCYTTPEVRCDGCTEIRPVWARREDGLFCQSCFDQPLLPCLRCGERRRIPKIAVRGRIGWCVPCCREPLVEGDKGALTLGGPCVGCGREIKIQAYLPDGPRCSRCYDIALERREYCQVCGEFRRVFFWPGRCATCLGIDVGQVCISCGTEARLYAQGRCIRCELAVRVDAELGGAGDWAKPLADRLKATESPKSTLGWLSNGKAWELVRSALASDLELSHEDLDRIPRSRDRRGRADTRNDVEYARALLVSAGLLPVRAELAQRFQAWADEALTSVPLSSHRWVLRRFCQERLVPTVEYQERLGKATNSTVRWAQARLRATSQFMEWMTPRGGLSALNRTLLDEWLAGSTARFNVRDFVRWAVREKLVDLPLKAMPMRTSRSPAESIDHDDRIKLAQRLFHEEGIATADRVAGLLIVLYGQHLSRIVGLTTSDARLCPTRFRLGVDWIEVPEPMAVYVEVLVRSASQGRGDADQRWLFPGIKPGRHMSEETLGHHLAALGINSRAMRNAALFHLASSVQPYILYRLLGLHPNTAVAWSRVAGSIYAAYWSDVADKDLVIENDDLDDVGDEDAVKEVLVDLGLVEETSEFW